MKNTNREKSCQVLEIKVTPRSSKNVLAGWEAGVLKIRLKAVPEKGKANEELIEFLSEVLDISKSRIHLLRGHTGRLKQVQIEGLTQDELSKKLEKNGG